MNGAAPRNPGRRRILAAGSLTLTFALSSVTLPAFAQSETPSGKGKLPGSLDKEPWLDAWIRIDPDNRITIFTGKAELGQGIRTALLQVAAEELQVAPDRIALVTADTARTPNEGYTAGSHSMQDSGTALRQAAAQVHGILADLAAAHLRTDRATLFASDAAFRTGDGRRVTYGELVASGTLHVRADGTAPLRDPATHTVSGKSLPRVDIPAKVTGGRAYVQDLRLPGIVHGRIVRPPAPAARLLGVDTGAVARLPGVLKVVQDGRFLAVIADGEYRAVKAAAALARAARWDVPATLPADVAPAALVQAMPARPTTILARAATGTSGAAAGGRTLKAAYSRPFQLHGSIGPSCAVAQLAGGRYTVWTHTQGVFPLQDALAELLGVGKEAVHCIHVEGSGCYGHNAADDVAADAALLARALPGPPVRVQWMREDEHGWEPFGPPMLAEAQATLDAVGRIVDWRYSVTSPPHNARPGKAGNLLAATHLAHPFTPPPPTPIPQPEGGGDRNAIPYYVLPAAHVEHRFIQDTPLRTSALRSLGAYLNVFAIESFMDELAHAAAIDPVAFRLRHLDDPRAVAVVRSASARFGWDAWRPAKAGAPRRGRGFAFARYKNLAAYCALALEVEVARESGHVQILRVVAAVDCGEVVNPDGVRNQIEGGIIQSASWTQLERIRFAPDGVLTRDWGSYPILRFDGIPLAIDVELLDRSGQPFLGTGEAAQGPAAAALANAIADASGLRLRDVPLDSARVRGA
jgi:nicotinate dehydrogenase subunit B